MPDLVRTIGRGTAVTTLGTVLLKATSILTVFVILNTLSVYEYGLFELAVSAVGLFGIFSLPGLGSVVVADMGIEKSSGNLARMKQIIVNYATLLAVLGMAAWTIIFFGASIIAGYYSGQITGILKILSFGLLVSPFRSVYSTLYSVNYKYLAQSLHSLIEEISKFVLVLVFFYGFHKGLPGLAYAAVLSQLVPLFLMAPFLVTPALELAKVKLPGRLPFWESLFDHGKWGMLANYSNSFGQNIRAFMIRALLGTEAVGLFAVAQGLIGHTTALVPLSTVITPILPQYTDDKERFGKLVSKGIKYQLVANVILVAVGFIAIAPLVSAIFPKYVASIGLYRIMLAALVPLSIASVLTPVFHSYKLQRSLFSAIWVKNTSILILGYVLMSLFGIIGIALEYVLSTFVFTIERLRFLRGKMGDSVVNLSDMLRFDEMDRAITKRIGTFIATRPPASWIRGTRDVKCD